MENGKKLYFIYNPHSGREQIRTKLYHILQIFSEAGYEVTVHPTREEKDAVKQIVNLSGDYDLVVCSGGEGTIDEVVEGMMHREKKIPLSAPRSLLWTQRRRGPGRWTESLAGHAKRR